MKVCTDTSAFAKRYFEEDADRLRKLTAKFVDLANADNFVHENEVKLIKMAIKVWKLKGSVNIDADDRLVYTSD